MPYIRCPARRKPRPFHVPIPLSKALSGERQRSPALSPVDAIHEFHQRRSPGVALRGSGHDREQIALALIRSLQVQQHHKNFGIAVARPEDPAQSIVRRADQFRSVRRGPHKPHVSHLIMLRLVRGVICGLDAHGHHAGEQTLGPEFFSGAGCMKSCGFLQRRQLPHFTSQRARGDDAVGQRIIGCDTQYLFMGKIKKSIYNAPRR